MLCVGVALHLLASDPLQTIAIGCRKFCCTVPVVYAHVQYYFESRFSTADNTLTVLAQYKKIFDVSPIGFIRNVTLETHIPKTQECVLAQFMKILRLLIENRTLKAWPSLNPKMSSPYSSRFSFSSFLIDKLQWECLWGLCFPLTVCTSVCLLRLTWEWWTQRRQHWNSVEQTLPWSRYGCLIVSIGLVLVCSAIILQGFFRHCRPNTTCTPLHVCLFLKQFYNIRNVMFSLLCSVACHCLEYCRIHTLHISHPQTKVEVKSCSYKPWLLSTTSWYVKLFMYTINVEPERLWTEKKLRQYKTRAAGEGFMPRLFLADKREGEGFIVLMMVYSRT